MFHRTVNDVKVLEICEVPPIRTSFIKELGEGAFGKVHKALHQDALEFFKCQHDSSRKRRKQFVAVKELHGGCGRFFFYLMHSFRVGLCSNTNYASKLA